MATLRKYWQVLLTAVAERMAYRTDFFLGTIMRFTPIVTTILLWQAVFRGAGVTELHGLSYEAVVGYYLMTMISRAFSSMPALAAGFARQVREGTIQSLLIQPVHPIGFFLVYRVAHKVVYYSVAISPYIAVFYLCRRFLPELPPPHMLAGYVTSLLMAFLLGYFFELSLGMLSFWFLNVTSFVYIVMCLNYFFSGHMVPLDLLPDTLERLLKLLPFQYLAYFPSMIILGRVDAGEMVRGLVLQGCWVLFLAWFCNFLYRRGLRRYAAYGG